MQYPAASSGRSPGGAGRGRVEHPGRTELRMASLRLPAEPTPARRPGPRPKGSGSAACRRTCRDRSRLASGSSPRGLAPVPAGRLQVQRGVARGCGDGSRGSPPLRPRRRAPDGHRVADPVGAAGARRSPVTAPEVAPKARGRQGIVAEDPQITRNALITLRELGAPAEGARPYFGVEWLGVQREAYRWFARQSPREAVGSLIDRLRVPEADYTV